MLYPRVLGTSVATIFGAGIQKFTNEVLGTLGSTTNGIDIEFIDQLDNHKKYCQLKSGPNTINNDDVSTVAGHFKDIINLSRTNNLRVAHDDLIVGVIYGAPQDLSNFYKKITNDHHYPVYVGQEFWHRLTGDPEFYDDLLSGGFPCQAFSYAGKKLGFEDIRGTLFFEFARAVKETNPKVIVAENVRGLLKHENGKTLEAITSVIDEIGYELVDPRVLKAMFYQVPQKRERLFLVGIRKDLAKYVKFNWPAPYTRIMTLSDALKKGILYSTDVPSSAGQTYPKRKAEILASVPQGGYWRDLPDDLQREYMKKSYFLGGGKTGMARRLAWDEPSLTLTCAPAQKQTERCHPEETRPLTVREYARIQTFPDDWSFSGPITAQYKQIGNAVPVNLAYAVGRSLVTLLNGIESLHAESQPIKKQRYLVEQLALAV